MFGYEKIELKTQKGKSFCCNIRKLSKQLEEVDLLLNRYNFLRHYSEPERELQEGIIGEDSEQRRINQENAYEFILKKPIINEDNLHRLYDILSTKQLDEDSSLENPESYRKKEVFILDNSSDFRNLLSVQEFDKGVPASQVKEYMDSLFEYLNKKDLDSFMKAQIAHFYFVYIHPFYDVNGRTARTLSSWYLLNKDCKPYTLTSRGINFNKLEYLSSIKKSRKGDFTPFLEFSINTLKEELKLQIILRKFKDRYQLSLEEIETLELLLRTNNRQLQELLNLFHYQKGIHSKDLVSTRLMHLIEKNVVSLNKDTKEIIIPDLTERKKYYRRKYEPR